MRRAKLPPFDPSPVDLDVTLPPAKDGKRLVIDEVAARRARAKVVWIFAKQDRIAAAH